MKKMKKMKMKNSADLGRCYPPRPKAKVDIYKYILLTLSQ